MRKSLSSGPRGPKSNLGTFPTHMKLRGKKKTKKLEYAKSRILTFAEQNVRRPTPAEIEFAAILDGLAGGALLGKYRCQHVISGRWIVDFFFPEIRLAVEIDGSIHGTDEQQRKDHLKDADCNRFDITMVRITNAEVAGDRGRLVSKLREGWRRARDRENMIIGKPYSPIL